MRGVRDDFQLIFLDVYAKLGVRPLEATNDVSHLRRTDREDMSAEDDGKRGWLKTTLRFARRVVEENCELENYTVSHPVARQFKFRIRRASREAPSPKSKRSLRQFVNQTLKTDTDGSCLAKL